MQRLFLCLFLGQEVGIWKILASQRDIPVSYTHLDVYKRQDILGDGYLILDILLGQDGRAAGDGAQQRNAAQLGQDVYKRQYLKLLSPYANPMAVRTS